MTKLGEAALASIKTGVGLESLYAELVKLARPEDRELVGYALNLDREFSAFVRRTGDAIQWLLGQQRLAAEPIDDRDSQIVMVAARKFSVTAEAIERAFDGVQSKQINYLKSRNLWPLKRGV